MATQTIGVHMTAQRVRIVQARIAKTDVAIERVAEGAADDALRALVEKAGLRRSAPAAANVAEAATFYRVHETDLANPRHLRQVLPFELEDELPVSPDGLVVDFSDPVVVAGERRRVLVAATDRDDLRRRREWLADAGLRCQAMIAAPDALLGAWSAVSDQPDGLFILAHVSEASSVLAVCEGHRLRAARVFDTASLGEDSARAFAREVELTWRAARDEAVPEGLPVNVLAEADVLPRIAALGDHLSGAVRILHALPGFAGDTPELDARFVLAFGLAVRASERGGRAMNFHAVDTLAETESVANRRAAVSLAALLCALAVIWVGGLFVRWQRLEKRRTRLEASMRKVVQEAAPEIAPVRVPLVQLRERHDALKKECNAFSGVLDAGIGPLKTLQLLSARVPPKVSISDLALLEGTVRVTGVTDSFESVDALKTALEALPEFEAVQVEPIDVDRNSGAVGFTVLISVAQTQ